MRRLDFIDLREDGLQQFDCSAHDQRRPESRVFRQKGETVAFSWIEWPDNASRDVGMDRFRELAKTDSRFDMEKEPRAIRWRAYDLRRLRRGRRPLTPPADQANA